MGQARTGSRGTKMKGCGLEEKTNAGKHLRKMEASRKQMCVVAVRPGPSYVIQQPFPSSNSD